MKKQQSGFSLIELMVVLVIMTTLLGIAIPSYSSIRLSTALRGYTNDMVTSIQRARSESIKRNLPMKLCASEDGATCADAGEWDQGWIVLAPDNTVLDSGAGLKDGFRFFAETMGADTPVTEIDFNPTGVVEPAADFVLCRTSPEAGHQERSLRVGISGRTQVDITSTGVCPAPAEDEA